MQMKKLIIIVLVVIMLLPFGCGKSSEASKADELILSIGTVDLQSKDKIQSARVYYDLLTDKQKNEVENYPILEKAESNLAAIVAEEKAAEEARIAEEKAAEEAAKKAEEEAIKKEAEEAAKKAEEEQRKLEDSIPPAPLSISNIKVRDYYSSKEIYAQFTNTGDSNIEAFDFYVIGYDAYGEVVKYYGSDLIKCTYDEDLKSGKTTPASSCWKLYNVQTIKNVKIAVFRYKLAGKEVVEIPERKLIWITQ